MANDNISANIIGKCTPAMSVDTSRLGGLSLTTIAATTPDDLFDIYTQGSGDNTYRIMGNLLNADFKGVACLAKDNGEADWIKATTKILDASKFVAKEYNGQSMYRLRPFIEMEVENPVNNIHWNAASGRATSASAGTDTEDAAYTAGARWTVTVTSQRGVPVDVRWFPAGFSVTIEGADANNVHIISGYTVVASEIVSTDLLVHLVNIGAHAADPIYVLAAAHRGNPVYGVLRRGLPNVMLSEKYCENMPILNTTQLKPFWIQETRRTFYEDSEWDFFDKMIRENNPLYAKFGTSTPMKKAQQEQDRYNNQLVESFFRNPALANQSLTGWGSLEKIEFEDAGSPFDNTFTWSGKHYAYKANALGVWEQLAECTDPDTERPRLIDMLGEKLDIATMKEDFYRMNEIRRSNGQAGTMIELTTHSRFREVLVEAFVTYYTSKPGGNQVRFMKEMSDKLVQAPFGWTFREFNLDFPAITIRLMSHPAFDYRIDSFKRAADNAAASAADQETFRMRGNVAAAYDWQTIYRAMLDSGKVVLSTGTAQEIAKVDASALCGPLWTPTRKAVHFWERFTTIVECPLSSIVYTNFDDSEVLQVPESA